MASWAIITGAGTGIGAALAKELASKGYKVLIVGRRLPLLLEVQKSDPQNIIPLSADIVTEAGMTSMFNAIPQTDKLKFLVQNAAIGEPAVLRNIKREDFEHAFTVNVSAPLFLTQKFLDMLQASKGRVLHIGTGVAFRPQLGTTTYGLTKLAFHRLYEQLKVELQGTGVYIGSARPGVVHTEGLSEHIDLARSNQLPHVAYFDKVMETKDYLSPEKVAKFLAFMLVDMEDEEFSDKEWHIKDPSLKPRWDPNTE